jgi:hypothetical protein
MDLKGRIGRSSRRVGRWETLVRRFSRLPWQCSTPGIISPRAALLAGCPPSKAAFKGTNVVLYIAASLDECIAGPSGEIDWLFSDQDCGYTEFLASVDTVVMGRKTYEVSLSFGDYPYQGTRGIVFSRIRREPDEQVTPLCRVAWRRR